MKSKKIISVISAVLAVLMIATALSGCSGASAELKESKEKATKVISEYNSGLNAVTLDCATEAFAKGDKVDEALNAGADYAGGEELVPKIQNEGWLDFDVVIATPDMMGVVGRLGRVLGPKGLMPNPKAGTVTPDVVKAIADVKAGKIEYRLDKANIIHVPVGKASFSAEQIAENYKALMDAVVKAKPSSAKGTYLKSVTISSTMGPGLKLNPMRFSGQSTEK